MKILVLGGTRFVGPAVVDAAVGRGHALTLFNRGRTNVELFPKLEKLRGDREKKELDALRGRKWDAVVDTYVDKPRLVREALEVLAPNVGMWAFVSSISVYADLSRDGVDESAPVAQLSDPAVEELGANYENFGGMKALCEAAVLERMGDRGCVVRPHLIVGARDRSDRLPYWVARVARGGEVLAPGAPDAPVQFIDVLDLGAFLVKLIEDGHGGVYNAAGPRGKLSMQELLHGCKIESGADASFTWVDGEFLLKNGASPWKDLPLWPPPGNSGVNAISNAKALAVGLTYRPTGETLRSVLAALESRDASAEWRSGLTEERERALLAAWRARTK